ncbi:Domain of uncharacterised function (DUF1996) [Serratia quinivorans]|uniref:DUF1996 domain-containing protein n=1 Tax=Serratia quinivorans TaxID=137545 RepID=UPI002178E23B|nr:DUF1996 domain-containing protein [Serratia quinivorans]CAI1902690.1 Domain of uncharacterised function (DUF1996) [Serratia quinivorans]
MKNKYRVITLAISCLFPLSATADSLIPEYAPTEIIDSSIGQFNVVCDYSHTLADDPIVMPGKPGLSMSHDFFGNRQADAFSTLSSLKNQPETTCTSPYDHSSYWAPQLQRANGQNIVPKYIKVYYRNEQPQQQATVPMPAGLQLLVGNHHRPEGQLDDNIWYYCRTSLEGGEHSKRPPTFCPQVAGLDIGAELNLVLTFPDCWDGKNLTTAPHQRNASYSEDGICPAAFPVKIPQLNMRIHYPLGDDSDLQGVKLSMSPQMDANGNLTPTWGTLYSAHADFFSAWEPRTTRYTAEECLNRKVQCDKDYPGDYQRPEETTWLVSGHNTPQDDSIIKVQGSQNIGLLKFHLPESLNTQNINQVDLRIYGRQVTGTTGRMFLYPLPDSVWTTDAEGQPLQQCPKGAELDHAQMWDDSVQKTLDVTQTVLEALQQGKRVVRFCLSGKDDLDAEFGGKNGVRSPVLRFNYPVVEQEPEWDAKHTYATACHAVRYQQKVWLNGWWAQGHEPGKGGDWGVWREKGSSSMHGECSI